MPTDPSNIGPEYPSRTHKYKLGCGSIYVTIVRDPEDLKIIRVFANIGKAGGCAQAQTETVCRMITRAIRAGDDPSSTSKDSMVASLGGIRCHRPAHMGSEEITSCADAIGRALNDDISIEKGDIDGLPGADS